MNIKETRVIAIAAVISVLSATIATAQQESWKLVWYDHFKPNELFEVMRTDISVANVSNDLFHEWCAPFNRANCEVLEVVQVAGDEHWKVPSPTQFLSERGLPTMNERWFQIMDDGRWYAYRVRPR